MASIWVLSQVEPLMHAVLNAIKRIIVIGIGALWMLDAISAGYVGGAIVAIVGASAYSLSKVLRSSKAHSCLQFALCCTMLLLVTVARRGAQMPRHVPKRSDPVLLLSPPKLQWSSPSSPEAFYQSLKRAQEKKLPTRFWRMPSSPAAFHQSLKRAHEKNVSISEDHSSSKSVKKRRKLSLVQLS
mmetsp:Transcript_59006/g.97549  ORF Transcript_59006/g.97549 Transcript_59006/m.97549 type:complete len:185 (+) Transcript_59006:763-1317(+)